MFSFFGSVLKPYSIMVKRLKGRFALLFLNTLSLSLCPIQLIMVNEMLCCWFKRDPALQLYTVNIHPCRWNVKGNDHVIMQIYFKDVLEQRKYIEICLIGWIFVKIRGKIIHNSIPTLIYYLLGGMLWFINVRIHWIWYLSEVQRNYLLPCNNTIFL